MRRSRRWNIQCRLAIKEKTRILLRNLLREQEFFGRDPRPCSRSWHPAFDNAVRQRNYRLEQISAHDVVSRNECPAIAGVCRICRLPQHDRLETHSRPEIVLRTHRSGRERDLSRRERIKRMRAWSHDKRKSVHRSHSSNGVPRTSSNEAKERFLLRQGASQPAHSAKAPPLSRLPTTRGGRSRTSGR